METLERASSLRQPPRRASSLRVIWTIAINDMGLYLLQTTVWVSAIIIFFCGTINCFVLLRDHIDRKGVYKYLLDTQRYTTEIQRQQFLHTVASNALSSEQRIALEYEALQSAYAFLFGGAPNPLSILAGGMEARYGRIVRIVHEDHQVLTLESKGGARTPSAFPSWDLCSIIKVVAGLSVIMVACTSISSIKETGILQSVMSNPVSAMHLFWGKYLGLSAIVLVAALAAFLAYLIPLSINGLIAENMMLLLRVLLLFSVAVLFLFVMAGWALILSFRTKGALSLLVTIALWFVFVFWIPCMASPAMGVASTAPDVVQLDRERRATLLQAIEGGHSLADAEYKATLREADFWGRVDQWQIASVRLAHLSPAVCLQAAFESVCGTGRSEYASFLRKAFKQKLKLLEQGRSTAEGTAPLAASDIGVAEAGESLPALDLHRVLSECIPLLAHLLAVSVAVLLSTRGLDFA